MDENMNIIEEITLEKDTGKINISDDVVATIAGIAAAEIEGVAGMAGNALDAISQKLGAKKSPQKGVKVAVGPDGAVIDLYIVVEFGIRIPELAWEVQENVKNSVESMTGINVLKVNVRIDGVSFEKEKKKKDEPTEEEINNGEDEVVSDVILVDDDDVE